MHLKHPSVGSITLNIYKFLAVLNYFWFGKHIRSQPKSVNDSTRIFNSDNRVCYTMRQVRQTMEWIGPVERADACRMANE